MRLLNQQERHDPPFLLFRGGTGQSAASSLVSFDAVGLAYSVARVVFAFVAQPLSYPRLSVQMNEKSSSVGTGRQCFRSFYTFSVVGAVAVAQGGAVSR
jgi:hypothetical protein